MVETGLARLGVGVTLTQQDNLTAQFMQQYGDFIAVASADNLVELCGSQVNKNYLVKVLGWSLPDHMKDPAPKADTQAKAQAKPEEKPAAVPEPEVEVPEETAEPLPQEEPSDADRGGKKRKKK